MDYNNLQKIHVPHGIETQGPEQKKIGCHLKLAPNLSSLINQAIEYDINAFQFFLLTSQKGKYLKIQQDDFEFFIKQRRKFVSNIYIHCSYWINLASGKKKSFYTSLQILQKELRMAKLLEANYLVLHPGSANRYTTTSNAKQQGIDSLAKALNMVFKKEHDITLLLENTAHGNNTIGSELNDFYILRQKLDHPEKILFCLDFAHAFSYGYNIEQTQSFIDLLEKTMGIANIKLLHLSDSSEQKGKKIDKHKLPGEGLIGKTALNNLIQHPQLCQKQIILEPPCIQKEKISQTLMEFETFFFY